MITSQLINYVRHELTAGIPRDIISKNLAKNGWLPQDIAKAFSMVSPPGRTPSVAVRRDTESPSFVGRKILLSFGFIFATVAYTVYQHVANPQQTVAITPASPTSQENPPANSFTQDTSSAISAPPPKPTLTVTPPAPVPIPKPAPKPAGQYANGTYTGNPTDAYYGTVQVEVVIQNGALADARFLQYPNDRNTSRRINGQAMPSLTSEAIQAQNANVDIVSGATFTSEAFQKSLASALAQAKN